MSPSRHSPDPTYHPDDDDDQDEDDVGPADPPSAKAIALANKVAAIIIGEPSGSVNPGDKMSFPFQHVDKPVPVASRFVVYQGEHKLLPPEDPPQYDPFAY